MAFVLSAISTYVKRSIWCFSFRTLCVEVQGLAGPLHPFHPAPLHFYTLHTSFSNKLLQARNAHIAKDAWNLFERQKDKVEGEAKEECQQLAESVSRLWIRDQAACPLESARATSFIIMSCKLWQLFIIFFAPRKRTLTLSAHQSDKDISSQLNFSRK